MKLESDRVIKLQIMNTTIRISESIQRANEHQENMLIGFVDHKLSFIKKLRNSFSRFVHSITEGKGLKFYTEFPSGIISPVFKQLKSNSYKVVDGIVDKRKAKKMRSLNLIILVYDDRS